MKTFNQFAEDAEKIKEIINNNKGLQKVRRSVESGNINIKDLKNFATSDDAANLGKNVINTLLDAGQSQLNKARKRVNK